MAVFFTKKRKRVTSWYVSCALGNLFQSICKPNVGEFVGLLGKSQNCCTLLQLWQFFQSDCSSIGLKQKTLRYYRKYSKFLIFIILDNKGMKFTHYIHSFNWRWLRLTTFQRINFTVQQIWILAWCVKRQNIAGLCQPTFYFHSWSCLASCWIGAKIQILQNSCMTKWLYETEFREIYL